MARPYLIVMGNEKGGSGKSTTALHIVTSLLQDGVRVGSIDLDDRQKTLTRYIENRRGFCRDTGIDLPLPIDRVVQRSEARHKDDSEAEEKQRFEDTYAAIEDDVDVIVIDCPGADSFLSRLAHTSADTLITPVNDSFIDIDLLAKVDPATFKVQGPSFYAEMVWKARQRRMSADGSSIDWIVLRNRLSSLKAKNMENVEQVLDELRQRIGFRFVPGLGERVIYRELFLKGLTLLDLKTAGVMEDKGLTLSHVAARQELRALMASLKLPFYTSETPAAKQERSE